MKEVIKKDALPEEIRAFMNENSKIYVYDFRLMTDAEKKAVEAKMTIGDFLQFDPPALSATNFKPEILVGDLRFKGYLNGFPRLGVERSEAEYREDERRAAAAVRHAETKMINDIRGNPAELNARVKFLEETNGIKLSILNEKQR